MTPTLKFSEPQRWHAIEKGTIEKSIVPFLGARKPALCFVKSKGRALKMQREVLAYFRSFKAACAAANRAMGTRKGEQDT